MSEPERHRDRQTRQSGWSKAGWFAGIWLVSVLALAAVGGIIRWMLNV